MILLKHDIIEQVIEILVFKITYVRAYSSSKQMILETMFDIFYVNELASS